MARVLTRNEALTSDQVVWLETYLRRGYAFRKRVYPMGFDRYQMISPTNGAARDTVYGSEYGEWWRAWDEEPTEEEMEGAKWE